MRELKILSRMKEAKGRGRSGEPPQGPGVGPGAKNRDSKPCRPLGWQVSERP